MINIDFLYFMSRIRFQWNILSSINFPYNYLWKWYISEFKLSFVFSLFKTNIKDINRSTKWSNTYFGSILFPCTSSNRIVIFNLFTTDFIPLWSFWVKVINIESVKIANHSSFSSNIKSASKLFNFLIFWIIKSLEAVSRWLIKSNFAIISSRQNMSTPSKSIWNRWMFKFGSSFGLKIKSYHSIIKMPRYNWLSIRWCTYRNYKRFSSINRLTFVIL